MRKICPVVIDSLENQQGKISGSNPRFGEFLGGVGFLETWRVVVEMNGKYEMMASSCFVWRVGRLLCLVVDSIT